MSHLEIGLIEQKESNLAQTKENTKLDTTKKDMTLTHMKKERNGAVPGQETNLECTAHLLEAAAAVAVPGVSYA